MQQVTVKKDKLLETIKEKRKKHFSLYTDASIGYRKAVIEKLTEMLKQANDETVNNFDLETHLGLQQPQNHVEDYDTAIAMLEFSSEDEITLTYQEFQQYVEDKWSWALGAFAINSSYSGNA